MGFGQTARGKYWRSEVGDRCHYLCLRPSSYVDHVTGQIQTAYVTSSEWSVSETRTCSSWHCAGCAGQSTLVLTDEEKNFYSEIESDIDWAKVAHPFISHYITAAVATIKQSWQPSLTGPSNQKWALTSGGVSHMDLLWFPAECLTFVKMSSLEVLDCVLKLLSPEKWKSKVQSECVYGVFVLF